MTESTQPTTETDVNTAPQAPALVVEELPKEDKKPASGSAFYKNKLEEMEKTNRELAARLEEQKTNQLKEKENYKELWEIEKNKRAAAEEKAIRISKDYLTGLKMSAIEQAARNAGIIPAALSDIRPDEASMVEIEIGDKGSVSILGAEEYVEYLKETKGYMFDKGTIPRVNSTNPGVPEKPRELTGAELVELQEKDPQKYKEEMHRRLKLA